MTMGSELEIAGADASVAIVGAACRFPGATNIGEFWDLILSARDAVGEIPRQRFDARKWYSAEAGQPHGIRSLSGGFLDDVDCFDADFFDIVPGEAEQMDPQQRLLMEVVWHAVEDAGLTAEDLAGSNTGVYLTTFGADYWDILRAAGHTGLHAAMGAEGGMIAGRIAYHLDLCGPSMGISATCATSLVSVHLATRALKSGEIDLAIVGGASLFLSPDWHVALSEADMLSPSGRCRFADADADGYVRSEGAGVVILKRLSDAVRDGDRAYAAVLGSASGNNGRTSGSLPLPGRAGQEATLRAAYRDAGIEPGIVDYVEAHGPGTPAGDPVELRALSDVLGEGRPADRPCLIGSVKSNIGHLEGVAGVAGLIKAALVLWHRTVPPTLHVRTPVPPLDQPDGPLRLALDNHPLPRRERPRVAAVSAFGLSGAIAHVVLAELPDARSEDEPEDRKGYVLPISARHTGALRQAAEQYAELLGRRDSPSLADICHTAGARRTHFERRVAVVGKDTEELVAGLAAVAAGRRTEHAIGDGREMAGRPRVVFVYPGQGSQWPGMARDLLRTNQVFADRLAECDRAVRAEVGWSPIEHIERGAELATMDRVQPTLWAVQVALAEVWRDWGVEPDLLIGHSMGEIAAAVTAGALTVADGAAVICRRSALLAAERIPGAMWAVQLGEVAARRVVEEHGGQVCVGVVNSHRSSVLSGDPVALATIAERLSEDGVFCRQVPVDYASHARQVEPLRPQLEHALTGLRPRPGRVPVHSTMLDRVVDGSGFDATYWADNLIRPVRFDRAVLTTLADRRRTVFVEISPHPILHTALEDCVAAAGTEATVVASLRRDEPGLVTLLAGLATVYTEGGTPAWDRVNPGGRFVDAPLYAWQRKRFWVDGGSAADVAWAGTPSGDAVPRETPADVSHQAKPGTTAPDRVHHIRLRVSALLGVSDVDPRAPLNMQGLDSVFAVRLAFQIRTELGLPVTSGDLLTGRSIEQLVGDLPGGSEVPTELPELAEAG